jgi:acyl-CoA thioester hydrolase
MPDPKASMRECAVRLVIPFYDLDAMQIVWHGNYFKYVERARQALFDQSGLDLYRYGLAEGTQFPVTRCSIKHLQPLRFRDEIEVVARLLEAEHRIVVGFEIRKLPEGTLCARGQTEQVAVQLPGLKLLLDIPLQIREALEQRKARHG